MNFSAPWFWFAHITRFGQWQVGRSDDVLVVRLGFKGHCMAPLAFLQFCHTTGRAVPRKLLSYQFQNAQIWSGTALANIPQQP